jgi:hypothetical protein
MHWSVKDVKPAQNFNLILTFENGEVRRFDMKPYLDFGLFKELQNEAMFCTVHVSFDSIEWGNEADLDPEFLYSNSIPC